MFGVSILKRIQRQKRGMSIIVNIILIDIASSSSWNGIDPIGIGAKWAMDNGTGKSQLAN